MPFVLFFPLQMHENYGLAFVMDTTHSHGPQPHPCDGPQHASDPTSPGGGVRRGPQCTLGPGLEGGGW
jgi:hypothetical protein